MNRLSILLIGMTCAVIAGGIVILAFTFGWHGWAPIMRGVAPGLFWPAGWMISRRIKRTDPQWDEPRAEIASQARRAPSLM